MLTAVLDLIKVLSDVQLPQTHGVRWGSESGLQRKVAAPICIVEEDDECLSHAAVSTAT